MTAVRLETSAVRLNIRRLPLRPIYKIRRLGVRSLLGRGLDAEKAWQVVDELCRSGEFTKINFAGGEPLYRKDLFALLAKAKEHGLSTSVAARCDPPAVRPGFEHSRRPTPPLQAEGPNPCGDRCHHQRLLDHAIVGGLR